MAELTLGEEQVNVPLTLCVTLLGCIIVLLWGHRWQLLPLQHGGFVPSFVFRVHI